MKINIIALVWLIGGAVLMALELLTPGLIVVFFGVGAVIVGVLYWLGFISSIINSIGVWIVVSFVLVLAFRKLALKFFPSESKYQLVEEDVDAIGTIVEVIETVDEKSLSGRISYNGTSWHALSKKGIIPSGGKARILYRDNISWVVEPCSDDGNEA